MKAVGCEPSIFSGKPVIRIMLLLNLFYRSSVLSFRASFSLDRAVQVDSRVSSLFRSWRSIIALSAESWTESLATIRPSIEMRSFSMTAKVSGVLLVLACCSFGLGAHGSFWLPCGLRSWIFSGDCSPVGWLCFSGFPMFSKLPLKLAQDDCDSKTCINQNVLIQPTPSSLKPDVSAQPYFNGGNELPAHQY